MDDTTPPVPLELLLAHREWVRRVARALVRDDSRAADLEQDLWVKVIEAPPTGVRSIRAWLRTVLRNAAGNARRAEGNRARNEAAAAELRSAVPQRDLVAEADLARRVTSFVLELEEPYRTTVLLRFYEDLPVAEIARRQGLPMETVRTRLKRAVERLGDRMDRESGGDRRRWLALLLPGGTGVPSGRSDVPDPGSPGTARVGVPASAVGAAIGGILMTLKTKVALAAAAVALLLLGGAAVLQYGEGFGVDRVQRAPVVATAPPDASAKTANSGDAVAVAPPVEEGNAISIEVVVTDMALVPVAGARVSIHAAPAGNPPTDFEHFDLASPVTAPPPALVEAATDGAGRATLRLPEPGTRYVVVRAAGFATSSRSLTFHREWPGPPLTFALERACTLEGVVLEADGRPAGGVEVRARSLRGLSGNPWKDAVAVTSAAGRFHMENLVPAPVSVSARRDSLAWTGWTADLPRQRELTLRLPAGSIAACGRVVDDATGDPVLGASVAVHVDSWEPQSLEVVALHPEVQGVASTAEDGTFRLEGLVPGRVYYTACRKEGYLAWPDHRIDSEPRRDPTPPGGSTEKEIRLRRGVTIVGTVTDPEGRAVSGAVVNAYSFAGSGGGAMSAGSVRTGIDGAYRTPPFLPGRAAVCASALAPPVSGLYLEGNSLVHLVDPGPPVSFDVKPEGETRHDIRLSRGAGVVTGTVVDDGGRPVAGARVVVGIGRGFKGGGGIPATSGADGAYRIAAIAPGEGLRVWASIPGTERMGYGPFFDLADGASLEDQRIVVAPQPFATGRVVRADGARLRDAALYLYERTSSPPVSWASMQTLEPRPVGPDGSFRIGLRAGGTYYLLARERDCALAISAAISTKETDPATPVEVTLTLAPAAALRGRVLDSDGAPVPGARVTARRSVADDQPKEGYPASWSGEDGSFSIDSLPPGRCRIEVSKEGSPAFSSAAEAGGPPVEIRMPLFASIAGRVIVPAGEFPAVRVEVRVGETGAWWSGPVKADGTFESIPLDPAQRYRVRAWAEGVMESVRRDVAAGTRGLELRLSRTSAIEGRILDESGSPVAAPLYATAQGVPLNDSGAVVRGRSGGDGTFRLECNGELRYQVSAGGGDSGFLPRVLAGTVLPDSAALEIRLDRGVPIDGTVRDADGRAVGGVRLYAVVDGVPKNVHPGAVTDAAGKFSMNGVPAGDLRLRAWMEAPEKWVELGTVTAPATGVDLVLRP